MKNNIFYTYIYLDPRKPGIYSYGNYTFEYEPFYIGKGKGDRFEDHIIQAIDEKNFPWKNIHKISKIRKILKESIEPIILKLEENLSEQKAFESEIYLIWAIGRKDKSAGPLTNHSNGGEGGFGWNHTKETKYKLSSCSLGEKNHFFGKRHSEETKMKMSISAKKRKISLETRHKLSACRKREKSPMWGKFLSEETKMKISKSHTGKVISEETKIKMTESQKKRWKLKRTTI